MSQVDRIGVFRAHVVGYGVRLAKSGAVAVTCKFALSEHLNGTEWEDWRQYDQHVFADFWIIKKDGTCNEIPCHHLRDAMGWDGDLENVANKNWQPSPCQVIVKEHDHEGKTGFRVEWANRWDYQGDGLAHALTPDRVGDLKKEHGAKLRAMFGPKSASGAKTSTPKLPPPPMASGKTTTRDEAWSAFRELQEDRPAITDEQLQAMWRDAIESELPSGEETAKPEDWYRVKMKALIPF